MINIQEKICNKILSIMESGVNPFKVPFTVKEEGNQKYSKIYPINYLTNKIYQGINQMLIPAGYYLTFNQVKSLKGTVKKGAKSYKGYFKSFSDKLATEEEFEKYIKPRLDKNPDLKSIYSFYSIFELKNDEWHKLTPFYKEFNLFNICDCENIPVLREENNEIEFDNPKAKEVIDSYCQKQNWFIENGKEPDVDFDNYKIIIPKNTNFKCEEDFYLVAFDTISHSTAKTLKREIGKYGGSNYSREMLTNQITSILSLASCNLLNNKESIINSGSYMKDWVRTIQGNNLQNKILQATEKAIKSYNLIFEGKNTL